MLVTPGFGSSAAAGQDPRPSNQGPVNWGNHPGFGSSAAAGQDPSGMSQFFNQALRKGACKGSGKGTAAKSAAPPPAAGRDPPTLKI